MLLKNKFVFSIIIFCVYVTKVSNQNFTNGNIDAVSRDNTHTVDSSSITVTDTPSPNQGSTVMSDNDRRKKEIMDVVQNNLSSPICKDNVLTQFNIDICLKDGCERLEYRHAQTDLANCTQDDYSKLHAIVCKESDPTCPSTTSGVTTTNSSALSLHDIQVQQIKCVIFNELSSETCKNTVFGQASRNDDIQAGCRELELLEIAMRQFNCTDDDYAQLHNVICTWDGKERCVNYYDKQMSLITQRESELSKSCSNSIFSGIKSDKLSDYCRKLTAAKGNLVDQKLCNVFEFDDLKNAICCKGVACFNPELDTSTREGRVMHAISQLSPMCSGTMAIARNELAQPPEQACAVLEATKPALLESKICTSDDYSIIQRVACNTDTGNCDDGSSTDGCTTTIDPFASEKEQRAHIQDIIFTELKGSCQGFMLDQAIQQINDPLEKSCKTLLDNRGFIVIGGQCTEDEYNILKVAICGNTGITIANFALLIICALFVFIEIVY